MKCYKCGNEFTQEDKDNGNYRQGAVNNWHHIQCPDKKVYWEEARDKQTADYAETESNEDYDASGWIVKK